MTDDGWQPIETAPDWSGSVLVWVPDRFGGFAAIAQKDAENIWLFGPKPPYRTFTAFGMLNAVSQCWPSHWRPLPAPPAGGTNG